MKSAIVCLDLNKSSSSTPPRSSSLLDKDRPRLRYQHGWASLSCVGRCEMIRKPAQLHIGTRLSQQPQIRYAPPGQPHAMLPNTHSHVCSRAPFRPWPFITRPAFSGWTSLLLDFAITLFSGLFDEFLHLIRSSDLPYCVDCPRRRRPQANTSGLTSPHLTATGSSCATASTSFRH